MQIYGIKTNENIFFNRVEANIIWEDFNRKELNICYEIKSDSNTEIMNTTQLLYYLRRLEL